MYQSPILPLAVMSHSNLGHFVTIEEYQNLAKSPDTERNFKNVINAASKRMMTAQFEVAMNGLIEVGKQEGFVYSIQKQTKPQKGVISLTDNNGHGMVGIVTATENGVSVNLDLTGYGNHKCHQVMDRILRRMGDHGIEIRNIQRKSHYRRQGISKNWLKPLKKYDPDKDQAGKHGGNSDLKRRQLNVNRQKIKIG